jgi:hypothetical protein
MEESKYFVETTTVESNGLQSPGLKNLFTAMAKSQAQLEVASKNANNPFFKSKYAPLEEVWKACRKALTDNGIAVLQFPIHSEDGRLHLETMLCHSSGESITRTFSTPVKDQTPQGYGSAITYLRRFALAATVGVVADEDDDGATASGTVKPGVGVHKATDGAKEALTSAQKETVDRLLGTVVDCFAAGNAELAYEAMQGLESDVKVALWAELDSKQRSAIKRVGEAIKARDAKINTLNA